MTQGFYQVAPRYTPGSPAMVNEATARQVAKDEQDAYGDRHRFLGVAHPSHRTAADDKGLDGIVEYLVEGRQGWDVLDLITEKRHTRPFATADEPKEVEFLQEVLLRGAGFLQSLTEGIRAAATIRPDQETALRYAEMDCAALADRLLSIAAKVR